MVLSAAAAGRAGRALVGRQSRVRLHEVGPRLELEIVKVCAPHLYCCTVPSQDGSVGQLDVVICLKYQVVNAADRDCWAGDDDAGSEAGFVVCCGCCGEMERERITHNCGSFTCSIVRGCKVDQVWWRMAFLGAQTNGGSTGQPASWCSDEGVFVLIVSLYILLILASCSNYFSAAYCCFLFFLCVPCSPRSRRACVRERCCFMRT